MESVIRELIQKALQNLDTPVGDFVVEHPEDLSHGDYSTNVAMSHAKALKMNPKELAEKIKIELEKSLPKEISEIQIAGPGFINFKLSREFFSNSVKEIIEAGKNFGKINIGENKKVLVEYSSPNIAKPFTVGHLRSTIIGDSISRILEASGYTVIRDNHLGDWGTQFGKMIVAIQKWGDLSVLDNDEAPIKTLVDLYVKFHDEAEKDPTLEDEGRAWFTKLEQKDPEATAIWKKCIELSLKEFERIYGRLHVSTFDTMLGESFFEDKMAVVLDDVKSKNIGQESEGAYLVFFPEEKKIPPLMLLKKDGSSLYGLRDLATDKYRAETYGRDLFVVNEVGMEQSLYFRQIFEAEEMLGYFPKTQRKHVAHGLYRFKDGKMSTRKGNVIWLDDIINEAVSRAKKINETSGDVVGVGAIKFNDLKRESSKDIVFDWEEMLNLQGDSGPYLQYSCVRARSAIEKGRGEGLEKSFEYVPTEVYDLEKMLYVFPEIVANSAREFAPHYIATYLIEISRAFSSFYGANKIVDKADPSSPYKLALTEAFSIVMKNGLNLLGIEVPEKM